MNCLNNLLFKDRAIAKAIAKAGMGPCDIAGVGVKVLPLLVKAALANSSLLARGRFRQRLRQAQGLAIALTK